nr:hypothetical protein [Rhodopseudomonas palustris]
MKALLDRHRLPYFHMVECAHGSDKFKTLGALERIDIATQMIALIRRFALFGVAVAVDQDEYRSIFPNGSFPPGIPLSDPYSYCCHSCLVAVQGRLDRVGFKGSVGYFFEAGHNSASKFQGLMDQIFRSPDLKSQYRYSAHGFVPKTHRPVQAADMLAWLHYTDLKNQLSPKFRPRRKDFIALCDGFDVETKMVQQQHLLHMRAQTTAFFEGWPLLSGKWGPGHQPWANSPFVAAWSHKLSS